MQLLGRPLQGRPLVGRGVQGSPLSGVARRTQDGVTRLGERTPAGKIADTLKVENDVAVIDANSRHLLVRDSATPANNRYITLQKAIEDGIIDYTSPSPKLVLHADGELKYAAHNFWRRSEELDDAVWTKAAGVTVTANDAIGPNGRQEADLVTIDSGGTGEYFRNANYVLLAGFTYRIRFYAKSVSGSTSLTTDAANVDSEAHTLTTSWQLFEWVYTPSANRNWIDWQLAAAGSFHLTELQISFAPCSDEYIKTTDEALITLAVEYDTNGQNGKLVVEPAVTNLDANNTDSSTYTEGNTTLTENEATGVDGQNSAFKMTETAAAGEHYLFKAYSLSDNQPYVNEWYVKKGVGRDWVYLRHRAKDGTDYRVWFNINTGAKGTENAGVTGKITPLPNGWYKISSVLADSLTGGVGGLQLLGIAEADNDYIHTGDTDNYIHCMWGQFVQSDTPSSPIITAGATVTRARDQISASASKLPNLINGFTVVHKASFSTDSTTQMAALSFWTDTDNRATLGPGIGSGTAGHFNTLIREGAVQYAWLQHLSAQSEDVEAGFAVRVLTNDFDSSHDGSVVASDDAGNAPSVDTVFIGEKGDGTQSAHGKYAYIKILGRTDVTNDNLQSEAAA